MDVVYIEAVLCAAVLAGVVVALLRRVLLEWPIWTPVINSTPFPCHVIWPGQECRLSPPSPVARSVAEHSATVEHLVVLLVTALAALYAIGVNPDPTIPSSVDPLPRPVTLEPAEWLLGVLGLVVRTTEYLVALCARNEHVILLCGICIIGGIPL